jgi:hypothetical protein
LNRRLDRRSVFVMLPSGSPYVVSFIELEQLLGCSVMNSLLWSSPCRPTVVSNMPGPPEGRVLCSIGRPVVFERARHMRGLVGGARGGLARHLQTGRSMRVPSTRSCNATTRGALFSCRRIAFGKA